MQRIPIPYFAPPSCGGEGRRDVNSLHVPNFGNVDLALPQDAKPPAFSVQIILPVSLHALYGEHPIVLSTSEGETVAELKQKVQAITGMSPKEVALYSSGGLAE